MPERHSDTILKRLLALHPKVIDLSLDRMETILQKLGNPERKLPPVIHVAGTNGKGSLLAYLRSILEASGKKVHVYTSPHLVKFAERIVLAGEVISETKLSELLLECERINGPDTITYFEVTTAAAFKAFAETPADILLLETGLGGRLDATNMVDAPLATAITPVSQDHEQFLGNDLAGIAGEKAGILKAGIPAIFGPQTDVALEVLKSKAASLNAPIHSHAEGWSCKRLSDLEWEYEGGVLSGVYPHPNLNGLHQIANAATALAVLEKLEGFSFTKNEISKGLTSVSWPARLQRLTQGEMVRTLPTHTEIWLDGGHNEAAAARLSESFSAWNEKAPLPLFMVCGMMANKEQGAFLSHFQPLVSKAVMVGIPGEEGASSAKDLCEVGIRSGLDCQAADSVEEALNHLYPYIQRAPCRLLIAGSLYLAGTILQENG